MQLAGLVTKDIVFIITEDLRSALRGLEAIISARWCQQTVNCHRIVSPSVDVFDAMRSGGPSSTA